MGMALPGSDSEALAPSAPRFLDPVPATAVRPAEANACLVYLAKLAPSGRRTMASALRRLAFLLTSGRLPVAGEEAMVDPASMPWERLRYQHTQALRTILAEAYAPATANKHLAALRGVMREAWRLGLMSAEDLARAVDVPSVRGSRLGMGRGLELGELRALFAACGQDGSPAGYRDAALLAVAYVGGLRRSELAALHLDQVEHQEGQLELRVVGKGNKERRVPLGGASEALSAWLALRGTWAGAVFAPIDKAGQVQRRGMTDQAVYGLLQRVAERAGVRHFTPHDLRRTCAGDLLDAGADVVTVQRLLGHAKTSTTAGYDRRGDRAVRKAAGLLHVPYVRPSRLPLAS